MLSVLAPFPEEYSAWQHPVALQFLGVPLALSGISLSTFPAPELLCPWEQLDGDHRDVVAVLCAAI